MCEYCHHVSGHHPRCPSVSESKIRDYCKQCGEELREDYEYYTDNEDNRFCSDDCALEYHGIKSKDWCYEEDEWWEED